MKDYALKSYIMVQKALASSFALVSSSVASHKLFSGWYLFFSVNLSHRNEDRMK